MRAYKDKINAQKKDYYHDRFYHVKETQKEEVKGSSFELIMDEFNKSLQPLQSFVELGCLVIYVSPEENLQALKLLKGLGFKLFVEMSAIDFIAQKGGFEVFYQLLNVEKRLRVRLKLFLEERQTLESAYYVFKGSNWPEREMYDMYGVRVINHPNFARILMPDDWHGHPLLKSYPLQGDEFAAWYEIDRIYGKEYRDIIGPENRDPGRVDDKDTFNFSEVYHECERGADARPSEPVVQEYQEDGGVRFVTKVKRADSKILDKRR